MNETDPIPEEVFDEETPELRTTDKRRFNQQGERFKGILDEPTIPIKSHTEIELEAKLKAETERCGAAEAKLIGVQIKFEEAKAGLEKKPPTCERSDENA